MTGCRSPDEGPVTVGLRTTRRVDDEVDLALLDQADGVVGTLSDLVDVGHRHAMSRQVTGRTVGRQQTETECRQPTGDADAVGLVPFVE